MYKTMSRVQKNFVTGDYHTHRRLYHQLLQFYLMFFILRQQRIAAVMVMTPSEEAGLISNMSMDKSQLTMSTVAPNLTQRLPPPRVKLNKCCLYGEYLDNTKTCAAGSSEHWIPVIFLINKKSYYMPQGSAPKFISFDDNVFPIGIARNIDYVGNTTGEVRCTVEDLELFTGTGIVIFSNGSLFISERNIFVPPNRYCVDQQAALVCFFKSKLEEPALKLRKCCGQYGVYDEEEKHCKIESSYRANLQLPLNENDYQTIYGFPECKEGSSTYAMAGDWLESQLHADSGHLNLPKHKVNLSSNDYCLEYARVGNSTSETVKIFACLHHLDPGAITRSNESFKGSNHSDLLQIALLDTGIVISVLFLAATLIASYLMPSVHHVLHWRCQIYYVVCLLVGDLLLAYTQLSRSLDLDSFLCQLIASTMHFFFLAAFFWLNTMCFNIWWTFRDFRPSSLERNQELLRLRLYSAYAWGLPMLITTIAVCVNLVPESSLLRPGFGEHGCWFSGERLSIFAYFFGPIGVLLCINIMLFVSTTYQLTCGLWRRDDVKSTTEKTALGKVCLKLVVVMGVTWIADVLSWIIGGPHSAWFFTDLINALQGVFIFLVVGCQPQVWAACKRFCCRRSRQEITNTTNGVQHSSSSQGLPSLAACGAEITQNTSIPNTSNSYAGHNTSTLTTKIPMETVC